MAEGWTVTKRANATPAAGGWRVTKRANVVGDLKVAAETGGARALEAVREKPMGTGEYATGLAANAFQGLTAGFGDELFAAAPNIAAPLVRASLENSSDPRAAEALASMDYDKRLSDFRQVSQDFADRRPIAAGVAQVAGAIPTIVGAPVARAATYTGRIARGAAIGAGFGGVAGFGEGEGGFIPRVVSAGLAAATGGALGGTLEAVLPPVLKIAGHLSLRSGRPPQLIDQTGALTTDGERVLRAVGVDPAEAAPDFLRSLQQRIDGQAASVAAPVEANARQALAESLPVSVPLTRGQKTLDPNHQGFEYDARAGAHGDLARNAVTGLDDRATAALTANMDAIRGRIAGGASPIAYRGAGGEMASNRLNAMADEARAAKNTAYAEAERLTPPTPLADRPFGNDARGAVDRLNGGRRTDTPDENFAVTPRADFPQSLSKIMMSKAWDALTKVDVTTENARNVRNILERFGKKADEAGLPVADIFQMRRSLTTLQGGLPSADTVAAKAAKTEIDNILNYAVDQSLLKGDTAAITAWKRAIGSNREYAQAFKARDLIGSLVEKRPGQPSVLAVAPEAAANKILGASDLSFVNKPELVREMTRLRDSLGPQSREWNALREETVLRLFEKASGAQQAEGRALSGAKISSAIDSFATKNPGLWALMFDQSERSLIRQFAHVMRLVTVPVEGARNHSGTGAFITRAMKNIAGTPLFGHVINWAATNFSNIAKLRDAQRAAAGVIPVPVTAGAGRVAPAITVPSVQAANRENPFTRDR